MSICVRVVAASGLTCIFLHTRLAPGTNGPLQDQPRSPSQLGNCVFVIVGATNVVRG